MADLTADDRGFLLLGGPILAIEFPHDWPKPSCWPQVFRYHPKMGCYPNLHNQLLCAYRMTDKATFIGAVQRCPELPEAVRESAKQLTGVETHSFDQSYIDFLDTQIRLSPRGPSWTERLKKRREGLLRFRDQTLLRSRIQVGSDDYTVEVDPKAAAVVYWERYEDIRADT